MTKKPVYVDRLPSAAAATQPCTGLSSAARTGLEMDDKGLL